MNWCKYLWGYPCRTIETFYHWDFCLWDFGFSTHFSHSAAWKNSEKDWAVSILHAYDGNCNCLFLNTVRWFPIANNLQEFFVHDVLSPDSWPRRSFHNLSFLPLNSKFVNFAPLVFSVCTILPRCHQVGYSSSLIKYRIGRHNPRQNRWLQWPGSTRRSGK